MCRDVARNVSTTKFIQIHYEKRKTHLLFEHKCDADNSCASRLRDKRDRAGRRFVARNVSTFFANPFF